MKDNSDIKTRAFKGTFWKIMEKVGVQAAQFVIQIILARLLTPEDYGLIGLTAIFIAVSDVFIQQGLTLGLIQKKNADERDYSSVFYANFFASLIIYGILYLLSPAIATFYKNKDLVKIMRILSLNVVIGSICAVHHAILTKNLEFKKSFIQGFFNILVQGITGLYLACNGFGVWSLVFSKIAGTIAGVIVLCVIVPWKPSKTFSWFCLKSLITYSSRILGTNLLNTMFNNMHSLIIGRYFTDADLGFYQRGQQIPQVLMTALDGSINEVLYPTLSFMQDDLAGLKAVLRRSMKLSMFIVMPLLLGLFAVSEPLVVLLLTEKWLPCVSYMQLSCIVCMFWPLAARLHALNAIGRSDLTFKISVISKIITIVFIFVCIRYGIYAIMLGTIAASCVSFWITGYYTSKYIGYTMKELFRDLFPAIALSLFMCGVVFIVGNHIRSRIFGLFVQIFVGAGVYLIGAAAFKVDSFVYVIHLAKNMRNHKNNNE